MEGDARSDLGQTLGARFRVRAGRQASCPVSCNSWVGWIPLIDLVGLDVWMHDAFLGHVCKMDPRMQVDRLDGLKPHSRSSHAP